MIYIREAHASDVWPLGKAVNITNHKTIQERKDASDLLLNKDLKIPILLDTMENTFDKEFAVWPERYFIFYDGKVLYIASPTSELGYNRGIFWQNLMNLQYALTEGLPISNNHDIEVPEHIQC